MISPRAAGLAARLAFARALAGDGSGLPPPPAGAYTRTSLYCDEEYEIVGFAWAPGIATAIHDHGVSACATLLLRGALEVERFRCGGDGVLESGATVVMAPGDLDAVETDAEFHRVRSRADEVALTVHVYAPPLGCYRTYDQDAGEFAIAEAAFGTFSPGG